MASTLAKYFELNYAFLKPNPLHTIWILGISNFKENSNQKLEVRTHLLAIFMYLQLVPSFPDLFFFELHIRVKNI